MNTLAKVIAAAAVLGTIAAVASTRRGPPKPGDIVAVPVAKLLDAGGQVAALPPGTIPADATSAVQVTFAEGAQVRGNVVGWVDPATGTVRRPVVPVGIGPFGFQQADIIGFADAGGKVAK